jgi:hypothetical protein
MSRGSKLVVATMLGGLLGGLLLAAPAAVADTSHGSRQAGHHSKHRARFDWTPPRTAAQTAAIRAATPAVSGTLQTFTKTIHDGTNFTYTMVGKDPFVAQSKPATTVKTYLEPVIVKFAGQT